MQILRAKVKYFGHIIRQNGVSPDPDKIKSIREMQAPTSKKELQSFLGMINFLRKFSLNLSETTTKLRDLLKSVHWLWSD